MHNLLQKTHDYILTHKLLKRDSTVIVGLSGGPDSVCLLHTLCALRDAYNLKVVAVHLDHGWRQNSADDAVFCKNLAQQLNVPIIVAHAEDIITTKKINGSREEEGRNLRRTFFEQCARENDASAIALGHHHDDQVETFFIRLIRGASIEGLAGMQPRDGLYIRPLLSCTKKEILEFLDTHTIAYRIDPTNISNEFLRNRIRQQLIPTLYQVDQRAETTIKRTLHNMQEAEQFLHMQTVEMLKKVTDDGTYNLLNIPLFLALDPFMQKRVLVLWLCKALVPFVPSSSFFDEIIRFLQTAKNNKHHIHEQWMIIKKDNRAHISHI